MRRLAFALVVCLLVFATGRASPPEARPVPRDRSAVAPRILVFTQTAGYRHDAIPVAIATLRALAAEHGATVDATEDPARFSSASLAGYDAVVFANVTGNVLDAAQRAAFERWVAGGGGFLGIHAAADSGYDWPWYGGLVGAWFARHPPGLQSVEVRFAERSDGTPMPTWRITDEIYDYRDNPRARVHVVATIDPASHPQGGMGRDHPIAWCHRVGRGRSWYTGLGHDVAMYEDPAFRAHLARGLRHVLHRSDDC